MKMPIFHKNCLKSAKSSHAVTTEHTFTRLPAISATLHLEKVTEAMAKFSLSLEYIKVTEAMAKCNLSLNYSQKIF